MGESGAPPPLLVIITGLPGTGKTTLGRRLAERLNLPFLQKDGLKETLFDSLGWSDRAWLQRLGRASLDLLFHVLAMELAARRSVIVEGNFDPEYHSARFLALRDAYGFTPLQLLCWADGATLVERFRARAASSARHPGHVELANLAEMEARLWPGRIAPLALPGALIEIETTQFAHVDEDALADRVRAALAGG